MAVQQTECYRVVTIGYLKDFIGTLIQDSSNGSVKYVNLNALSAEKRRDDYCPTYSELTSNSLVQTWNPGSTPNGDRDGIVVNSSAILGGDYAANQLVDQKDLSLMYTRFSSFSISASSNRISACSGTTIISYTHIYNRNSKFMNNSCTIQYGGNTAVTDTNDSEVSATTTSFGTFGEWVNHTKKLTIPKNSSSTGEAEERYTYVQGKIKFRGASHEDSVKITQNELTGHWLNTATSYDIGAWPVSSTTFGCDGGDYSAFGSGYTYNSYIWEDECEETYPSRTSATTDYTYLGTSGGSFSKVSCPTEDCSHSASIPFTFHDKSTLVPFVQTGRNSCGGPSQNCHVSSSAPKILPNTGGTITYILKFD